MAPVAAATSTKSLPRRTQDHSVNGFNKGTDVSVKSETLRVTSVRPLTQAVAAISLSMECS